MIIKENKSSFRPKSTYAEEPPIHPLDFPKQSLFFRLKHFLCCPVKNHIPEFENKKSQEININASADHDVIKEEEIKIEEESPKQSLGKISSISKRKLLENISQLPKKSLFFLSDINNKYCIIAKINEKKFETKKTEKIYLMQKSCLNSKNSYQENTISEIMKKSGGITDDNDKIARHISKRIKKRNFVILVNFDKDFSFEISKETGLFLLQINNIIKNNKNFDCIYANFETIKVSSADVVMIDFRQISIEYRHSNELEENMKNLILKTLKISKNAIFIFHKYYNIKQIPFLFNDIIQKIEKENIEIFDFSIEIEIIFINEEIDSYIVYFGHINNINRNDEINFLSSFLNKDISFAQNIPNIRHLLMHLNEKIALHNITLAVFQAETIACQNETIYQKFIDILRESHYFSLEELQLYMNSCENNTNINLNYDTEFKEMENLDIPIKNIFTNNHHCKDIQKSQSNQCHLRNYSKTNPNPKNSNISNVSRSYLESIYTEMPDLSPESNSNINETKQKQIKKIPSYYDKNVEGLKRKESIYTRKSSI